MQIFVHSVNGRETIVDLPEGATVKDLKATIEDQEFIPCHLQRIVFASQTLTSGSLSEMMPDASSVYLEVGIDGGMRAKWRKKRMRRLRRKRRKMRMRAR
jgi:small subunit ribosomal protein S27Ae